MDPLMEGGGWVVLTEQPNPMMAHWVAGGVEAEGIPVHVEENNLQDEFAVAQRAMGGLPIRVLVPKERYDEANTVFLNLSQPIPLVDDDDIEDEEELDDMLEEHESKVRSVGLILILVLLGVPFVIWQIMTRVFGYEG